MSAAGGVKKGERSVRTDPSSWAKRNFGAIHHRKPTGGRGRREAAVEDSASDLLCDTARCGALPTGGGGRTVRRIGAACLLSLAALMGSLCLDLNSSLAGWRETEDALHALVSCRNTLSLQLIGRLQEERGSAWKEQNNKSRLNSSNLTQTAQVLARVSALCSELRAGGQSDRQTCAEGAAFTCQQLVEGIGQNLGGNGTRHEDETDHIITSVISILLSGPGEQELELNRARANQDWADVLSFRLTLRAKEGLLLRSQPRPSSQQGDPQATWQWAAITLNHGLVISENMQQCCRKNMNLSLYLTQLEGVCLFYPSLRLLEAADQDVMLGVVLHLDIVRECLLNLAGDSMRKKSRDVLSELSYRITLLATACLIYPVVLVSFKQMTEWIQNYARSLKERTEDLSRQRRLAEDLLHQMLPKSVARQLRKHKHVEAESYEQVTIYFSDIVGFTTISASCTPLQVVQMLNSLYMCFDTRIESYDVYKVETIGDAYMVVSGLPERKGAKHADEIAKMALDLVAAVRQVPIPHMPTERLQLRAGIHTGPCVAGVVGYKMPRYCLFGDTVNTASRMESTSMPQKIHISSATFSCLMTDDDYEIELRGDTELKGKGKMKTYWLIGNKNYSVQNDSLVCHRNPRIKKRNENGESMASVQQSGTSSTAQTPSNRTTPLSLMEVSANGHPGTKSDCLQNADSQLALSSLKSSEHSESCSPNSEKGVALPDRGRGQEQEFYLRGTPAAESEPSTAKRDGAQAAHEDGHTEKSELLPGFVNLN